MFHTHSIWTYLLLSYHTDLACSDFKTPRLVVCLNQQSYAVPGPANTVMVDYLQASKQFPYITSRPGWLSLLSSVGGKNEYQLFGLVQRLAATKNKKYCIHQVNWGTLPWCINTVTFITGHLAEKGCAWMVALTEDKLIVVSTKIGLDWAGFNVSTNTV